MTKTLGNGSFVVHEAHPEHGLGRVVGIGAFATRVLFSRGGLRVFRADDTNRLKSVGQPSAADVALLDAKESALASGLLESQNEMKTSAPKAKKKKAAVRAG